MGGWVWRRGEEPCVSDEKGTPGTKAAGFINMATREKAHEITTPKESRVRECSLITL